MALFEGKHRVSIGVHRNLNIRTGSTDPKLRMLFRNVRGKLKHLINVCLPL